MKAVPSLDQGTTGSGGTAPVKPIVAVVGGSTCTETEASTAEELGRSLAHGGAIVLCGGLTGVMEAAARGARAAGGLVVGILPGGDPAAANPYVDVPIATGMGEMRNALIVRAAGAVIAVGGGHGTLSEVALAMRIGTPVAGLQDRFIGAVDMPRLDTPAAAAAWALQQAGRRPLA